MKTSFTIFYSWQSDIKSNKNLIQNCIEKALKKLKQEGRVNSVHLELNLDRDTKNKNGSPIIAQTIFNKIKECDIFIADVSNINETFINRLIGNRPTPNPNVMIELGFAIEVLGWERIICINNEYISNIEKLPFDIRGHRITNYNSGKSFQKENLVSIIKTALNSIITNYDEILMRIKGSAHIVHDKNIFISLQNICSEQILKDSLSVASDSLFTTKYYYYKWNEIKEFSKNKLNKYIDSEVQKSLDLYIKSLDEFESLCSRFFFVNEKEYMNFLNLKDQILSKDEYESLLQSVSYNPIKEPFKNESWRQSDKRISNLQSELYIQSEKVLESYENYIMTAKKRILT